MFKVTQIVQNRLDIEMSGKLDSEEMRKTLDELAKYIQERTITFRCLYSVYNASGRFQA